MKSSVVTLAICFASSCAAVFEPLLFQDKSERRNMDCVRLNQNEAADRFRGQIPSASGRSIAGVQPDVIACTPRYLKQDDRAPRDEAILSTLSTQVTELTESASNIAPEGAHWHVDAFYPSQAVAQKIAVAARTTLAERGFDVSDRVPLLAAGDVAVLATLPQSEVYRVACARSFETDVLRNDDVFFGLMIVDPQETQLHAGLCMHGNWRWLP